MSSSFYNSINTSTALLSRTQFPALLPKDELFQILHQYNRENGQLRKTNRVKAGATLRVSASLTESVVTKADEEISKPTQKKLKLLVAGGGIGGLVFALAAKRKGFDVMVFERDLSAIRGEGQYRGPIQIQSNALAALEAIDMTVAEEIMSAGCITGDRINGLVDGISGNWYIKFDTFTPAAERGLPVTRVISRMTLQQILARAVGEEIIMNESNVVSFEDDGNKVSVTLENGQRFEGDLLVGADGIWSKVRTNLFGHSEAKYSEYTCYTGIADFVPADIETVGYRVFLGHKQYFVSSDVGGGKMQWYAFHKEPPGGVDPPNGKKERLLKIFGGWCDNVIDLLQATDEEAILRRDIYDRTPSLSWGKGRVTLLGDSIHAMQPNLGQGGCMAIEDSYQLALELDKAWNESKQSGKPVDVISSLRRYESARKLRVAVIHGLARMAAIMASTYKPYLGVGLGPLSFLTKYRIPHPGRVGGRIFIDIGMPLMLSWVLGGNGSKLEGRPQHCRLTDKANDELRKWFEDDDALERALKAELVYSHLDVSFLIS
ncbi:OLC1v1010152C1 [Oldenlandia corymbosa var. corymbosa]|uniref:OLC1v1010152C1 n=1 Tax=Oldenlandia corymbosa var. corymbosa TaxID=529605 RepID=A0AAV1DTZ4_OLDCO|nr:OLC1v1010152C1 [Oldenlandia corymbosa var. corymbosa]